MATGSAKSADAGDEQTVSAEGTDKWEKWPDHWRWKGTPTVSLFPFPYFYLLRTGNSTDVVFCLLLGGPELRRRLH